MEEDFYVCEHCGAKLTDDNPAVEMDDGTAWCQDCYIESMAYYIDDLKDRRLYASVAE